MVLASAESFPEGKVNMPTRHPDIGTLMELVGDPAILEKGAGGALFLTLSFSFRFAQDGDLYDFRVIVLVRHLLESFLSKKARKSQRKHRNPSMEAAFHVEESLVINSIVSSLPCDKYVFLPVDYAVEHPTDALRLLSGFLDINATELGEKPSKGRIFQWHWKAGFFFGNSSLSLVRYLPPVVLCSASPQRERSCAGEEVLQGKRTVPTFAPSRC